jgi:microcystin-dependent protein
MATENLGIQNFFLTTLKDVCNANDTVIYLYSTPTPSEGYLVFSPDDEDRKEIIYYTSKNDQAGTVTCPSVALGRGIGGTSAMQHVIGEPVKMNIVAEHWLHVNKGINPIGTMTMFLGATEPANWLLCQGQSLLRADYPLLFAVLGTTYGSADSTHFTLPDMRQKFPLGKGASGTGSTLGATGGVLDHHHHATSDSHASGGNMRAKVGCATGRADVIAFQAGSATNPNTGGTENYTYGAVSAGGVWQNGAYAHWVDVVGFTDNQNPPFVTINYIVRAT